MEANKTIEMKSKQRAFFSSFKKTLYLVLIILAGMIAYFAVTIEDEVNIQVRILATLLLWFILFLVERFWYFSIFRRFPVFIKIFEKERAVQVEYFPFRKRQIKNAILIESPSEFTIQVGDKDWLKLSREFYDVNASQH